jgi:hypothetical protein
MRNSITGTANNTNRKKKLAANSDKKEEPVQFTCNGGCVPVFGLTIVGALQSSEGLQSPVHYNLQVFDKPF